MRVRLVCVPSRRGFTLVEIILVVAIIMTLVGLAVPKWAGQLNRQKIKMTRIEMGSVATALGSYEASLGEFPSSAQGLKALIERPADVPEEEWEQCLDKLPLDAWSRPFKYVCPSEHGLAYDLVSAGKDGRFGTGDDLANYDRTAARAAR